MVRHSIILGHEIFKNRIEVDKAKIEVIVMLPVPKYVKDIRSFFKFAGFYRKFIKDFSKIARPLTKLLAKNVSFTFDSGCHNAWEKLKMSFFLHQSSLHRLVEAVCNHVRCFEFLL